MDLKPYSARSTWERVTPARLVVAETSQKTLLFDLTSSTLTHANYKTELKIKNASPYAKVITLGSLEWVPVDLELSIDNEEQTDSDIRLEINPGEEKSLHIRVKRKLANYGVKTFFLYEDKHFSYEFKVLLFIWYESYMLDIYSPIQWIGDSIQRCLLDQKKEKK